MKRAILVFMAFLLSAALVSCSGSNKKDSKKETADTVPFDTGAEGYDPYAIVDYENPLTDAVSEDGVHIPKINVYLKGACALSDEIKADFEKYTEKENAKVSYSYEIQYDTVQIIVKGEAGGETEYRVYYYDALVDSELDLSEFISYCSIAFKDLLSATQEKAGDTPVDEDSVRYLVYHGDDSYDVYTDSGIYGVTVEKVDINPSEIMQQIEQENNQ